MQCAALHLMPMRHWRRRALLMARSGSLTLAQAAVRVPATPGVLLHFLLMNQMISSVRAPRRRADYWQGQLVRLPGARCPPLQ